MFEGSQDFLLGKEKQKLEKIENINGRGKEDCNLIPQEGNVIITFNWNGTTIIIVNLLACPIGQLQQE